MSVLRGFQAAVALILEFEGEHSNDPQDPGGDTWFGLARRSHPTLPWPPTVEAAIAVYRTDYWEAARCDRLPPPLALAVFDASVNQGVGAAVVMLQQALGVLADGVLGPVTIAAAHQAPAELLDRYLTRRAKRYVGTVGFTRFGDGWLFRLFRVARACATLPAVPEAP